MIARANSPATKRERLLELLRSRTQADSPWRQPELAAELCCSLRTVERLLQWLRDEGKIGGRSAIPPRNGPYIR